MIAALRLIAPCALMMVANFAIAQTTENKPSTPAESNAATTQTSTVRQIAWSNMRDAEAAAEGAVLYCRGTIISISPPRPDSMQPWTVYLTDETGSSRAVIFQETYSRIADPSFLTRGKQVDLYVTAQDYQRVRQLHVKEPTHIRATPGAGEAMLFAPMLTSGDTFAPLSVGAIGLTTVGRPVRIRGTVVSLAEPERERVPWRVIVRDETGEVEVVFWKDVYDAIPNGERPLVHQPIEVSGVVGEHRGKLQIRVDEGSRIRRRFTNVARSISPENEQTAAAITNSNGI